VLEAAQILGFAQVTEGDAVLTPLGKAFAEATILTRKQLVPAASCASPPSCDL